MCGIAGIWNLKTGNGSGAAVSAMLDAMRHRGPDGRGQFCFDGGAAGMVRLALVDLSDRGQQPLWSADRRVAILFNGEIYNFKAERERLSAAGFPFVTTTDTEVILNLYLERGLDFVDRLRGMYAVALFDWRETSAGGLPVMVLARGQLGIKPLYVSTPSDGSGAVLFASEVRALTASGLVERRVDRHALADYLACGFVVQPRTIYEGVRMMEAGTIERHVPGRPVERRRFWTTPAYVPRRESLDQAAERLRSVLDESIALHAFADAPVGAFLSGGVDSTGIVGLMRKHVPDLRTYTLRCPNAGIYDESQYAAATAKLLGCRNTVVEVTGREAFDLLPNFAASMDQPSNDGLNTWLISRAAAQDVKAVLSGLGGDEWFAGYPVTRRMAYCAANPLGRAKSWMGRLAVRLNSWLPEGPLRERAWNLAARRSPLALWLHARHVFHFDQSCRLVGLPWTSPGQTDWFQSYLAELGDDFTHETPVGLSCLLDFQIYMGNQLLRDSDVMSMAHSLELRTPFVDVEVVKFSRSCRDEYKLKLDGGAGGQYGHSGAKRVLIHALRDVLPVDIMNRAKQGFSLPYSNWMRGELLKLVQDTCNPATIAARGLIDPQVVAPLVRSPETIQANLFPHLWTLMLLELWCKAALDAPLPEPANAV